MPHHDVQSPLLRAAIRLRDERARPTPARVDQLRTASGVAGLVVLVGGLAVMSGWVLGIPRLTQVAPGLVTMKFNTAASLATLGLAVWLLARSRPSPAVRRGVTALAAGVAVLAAATLVEYTFSVPLGIDNPFGLDRSDAIATSEPGRMSPMTALGLLGVAGSLLALLRGRVLPAQLVAAGAFTVSSTAAIGYLFGIETLYRVGIYTSMAIHTAVVMTLLSLAVIGLRAGDGFVQLATGNTAGGVVVRRLLPWVLLAPAAVGGLLVAGLSRDWYGERFALAIFVSVMTIAGALLVWVQGRRLRNVDLRRAGAEDVMQQLEESLAERQRLTEMLTRSERRVREVIATSADAYISLSADGYVADWNDAATRLFGWSQEEAVGRRLEALIVPPELAEAHREGLTRAARTGEGPMLGRPIELEAVHRARHRMCVELTIWSVRDGDRWGFHASLRDITDRKAAEAELRQLNDDLSQFAGVVAHDLKNPLTAIAGFADLLDRNTRGSRTDDRAEQWIERIQTAAQRGHVLITDLLAFTRVGQTDLVMERVDLAGLLAEVVEEQRVHGHEQAVIDVGPLPVLDGDPGLLGQLFSNLVGNALKYAGAGSPATVRIDVAPESAPGRVVIRVADDGPGVPERDHSRIFDMFQRGSDVGSVSGTGIGLAISRRVVERHHGRIWVEVNELGGSTFCVELPLSPAPPAPRAGRAR